MIKPKLRITTRRFSALIILWVIQFSTLDAADFTPVFRPTLEIKRISGTIKIDGNLDDSGWNLAAKADNFVERYPGKNTKPEVATEVLITYDSDKLYVAFICHDDPAKIRATMCQRDQFSGDDNVCLLLDTYGNAAWAYELFVNPYGIQMDQIWSRITGEDPGFDLIWESAAKITSTGYQVEMAVPFASLRFPSADSQTWKIDFWRNHPREFSKQYSWAAYNPDDQCWVCQWGTLKGIEGVKPGKGLEVLPSVITSESGNMADPSNLHSRFMNDNAKASLSVGGKFSIASNATAEATYNPDFSQIEADAAQIDVNSTIALRYPERRPFFQEGSDIFQTPFNSFYSRTINDPQYAAKVTGRSGRYNLGLISAYDENTPYIIPLKERSILINTGKSAVNIFRATRSIGTNNFLGLILTDRRFHGGGYGTIFAVDGVLNFTEKYSLVTQYISSLTKEPTDSASAPDLNTIKFDYGKHDATLNGESYQGEAIVSMLRREARNWSFTIDYDHTSPTYRTETGYDPWNDYKNLNMYTTYNFYPSNSIFGKISPQLAFENRWDFDYRKKWTHGGAELQNNFTFAQAYFNISYFASKEKWQDIQFANLWNTTLETGFQPSNQFGFNFQVSYGPKVAYWLLEKGNETFIDAGFTFKPIDRLIIEPTLEYSRSKQVDSGLELYRQAISRTRVRFQLNKEFSLRLVTQYIDQSDIQSGRSKTWEIDPLITYRVSSFSVFYAGSTHNLSQLYDQSNTHYGWRQTSRQFFVKLQYLFRV